VDADVMDARWYAMLDDMIGGWCVMNADKSPSESNFVSGEWQVVRFTSKGIAQHIANLHNDWLDAGRPL
jgi:hypothetical protein